MKRLTLAIALFVGLGTFSNLQAQHISVNINVNSQPAWGPVGYDYAGYYYLPEIDCYYNVDMGMFHYYDRGRWISARYLPYAYRHYDLYRSYKVVINDRNPWNYHRNHKKHYAKYRNNYNQVVIYNTRDSRYSNSRQNRVSWVAPEHRSNKSDRRYNNSNNDRRYDNNKNYNKNKDSNRANNQNKTSNDRQRSNQNNRSERPTTNTQKENTNRNQNSNNYQSNLRYANNTGSTRSSDSNRQQSSNRTQSSERSSDSRTSRR